jgi:hypothetical protein
MKQRERSKQVWGKWRKLVGEQERSGKSVAVFCRERGLCAPHFYAWKKRRREADGGQGEVRAPLAKFVEVKRVPAGPGLLAYIVTSKFADYVGFQVMWRSALICA